MIFKWDVYLCGPTTFKGQEGVMRKAREILIANHLTINDPRENSTVVAMMVARGESKDTLYRQILSLNTSGIEASYAIVSCIDNQDTGTAWEMGFSCGLARYSGRYLPRITFSARGASPNALLIPSVHAHAASLEALERLISLTAVHLRGRDEIALHEAFNAFGEAPAEPRELSPGNVYL